MKSGQAMWSGSRLSGRENGAKLLDQGMIGVWVKLFAQKLEHCLHSR